jgi:hypothetical protein
LETEEHNEEKGKGDGDHLFPSTPLH